MRFQLLVISLWLIPSLAIGAGWDETITSPQPDDTIMINDVSQPDGSKTQYTSLKNLPVPDLVTDGLDTKVGLTGDETISGIKNFSSSPIVPEPASPSQAATKNYVDTQSPAAATVWGTIIGTLADQLDLNAALNTKVNNTGTEDIGGVKTFTSSPIVPTPTTDFQTATKEYVDQNAGIGGVVWGGITGTLSDQIDLQNALNNKAPILTSDQNYVSDAELLILQQTEGVNTGDQDISNFVQLSGNETIAGVKTFSSSPIVPTPTTGTQAATKDYADTKAPALTADQNYMTNAEKTLLGQQSNTNTGDQDLSGFVSKTGNETIQGIKTFPSSPVVPTPTTDFQAATKEYVDIAAGGGGIPEAPSDADAYGRDNGTWTPVLKTADVVTADVDEVTLTKDVAGQTVTLSVKDGGVGPVQVTNSLKTNTIQFPYSDASIAEEGEALRVPTSSAWTMAYSRCTVAETALVYELLYHATGGDLVSIGTVAHTSGTLVSQDISAFTDPVAGGWFTVNIITPASAATNCTLALDLLGN